MNPAILYGTFVLCLAVSIWVNFSFGIPFRAGVILTATALVSYLVWIYHVYKRNKAFLDSEEEFLYDIFLISPDNNVGDYDFDGCLSYVAQLEAEGARVYWPYRDTKQNDLVGSRICKDNREAMLSAEAVHIWYSKTSRDSIFNLGMSFPFFYDNQNIVIANPQDIERTEGKSFENMLLEIQQENEEAERLLRIEIRKQMRYPATDALRYD